MIDYTKCEWGSHPYDEDLNVFSLSVPQKVFRPLGHLLDSICDFEGDYSDATIADKLEQKPATVYYHSAEPEKLDIEWLESIGPDGPKTLIEWSNIALRQYVKNIEGSEFMGLKDDFHARVLESINEGDLDRRFGIDEKEIVRILDEQGVYPFLSVDEIVISQRENLYQICCECVLDTYFEFYGFGIYLERGKINFAAPSVTPPEF